MTPVATTCLTASFVHLAPLPLLTQHIIPYLYFDAILETQLETATEHSSNTNKRLLNLTNMACHEVANSDTCFDLLSWIFRHQDYDQNRPIFIDAEEPKRTISAEDARSTIRKLIAGLKVAGLNKGDCVCLHSFNNVSQSHLSTQCLGAPLSVSISSPNG